MDSYIILKVLFSRQLSAFLDPDLLSRVISCLDNAAVGFSVTPKETQLPSPGSELPDALRFFLAAKTVEEKSPKTLELYKSVLTHFFQHVGLPVREIATDHIRDYLSVRKAAGNKNVTIGNVRKILSSFFEWCALEGHAAANPVRRIASIKVEKSPRKAMKRVEIEYLRNACRTIREKAMVDFLYSTGVRISEFCHARIENIDWEKKSVLIEHGKGDVTRWTYLNPEAEVSLRAYLASRHDDNPHIFAPSKGRSLVPLAPRSVQLTIDNIVRASGRRFSVKIHPHIFRHTIATVLLRNGMPVEQVQRFLGHANINTTMIYAEVKDDDVRRNHFMYAA